LRAQVSVMDLLIL